MPEGRELNISEFLKDMRSGATDCELTQKYRLSEDELRAVFQDLLQTESISPMELYGWSLLFNNNMTYIESIRLLPREALSCVLTVVDHDSPASNGVVFNISQNGVGISGIQARVDEVKTLTVTAKDLGPIQPFILKARCRWIDAGAHQPEAVGGFEILEFIQGSYKELRGAIERIACAEKT